MVFKHISDKQQFTLTINKETARIDYKKQDNQIYLTHTEVPEKLRGTGIGKLLVEKTLEQLAAEDLKTTAVCSYIKAFVLRNEKWKSTIATK